MGVFKENRLTYTGAGVLVIEDYYTKKGTRETCLILVRNKASNLYTDFGGSYENKHGSLQITAQSELREESRNIFNVARHHLKNYVDIMTGKDNELYYRVFVIKINGISRKYFDHNVRVIDS